MEKNKKYAFIFGAVLGVLALAFGIYLRYFETRGFVKTTAVIERIDETYLGTDADGHADYQYDVYVEYYAKGKTYHGKSDIYSAGYKEGKKIPIYYNPENPEEIHGDSRNFAVACMLLGPIVTAGSMFMLIRERKKEKEQADPT